MIIPVPQNNTVGHFDFHIPRSSEKNTKTTTTIAAVVAAALAKKKRASTPTECVQSAQHVLLVFLFSIFACWPIARTMTICSS